MSSWSLSISLLVEFRYSEILASKFIIAKLLLSYRCLIIKVRRHGESWDAQLSYDIGNSILSSNTPTNNAAYITHQIQKKIMRLGISQPFNSYNERTRTARSVYIGPLKPNLQIDDPNPTRPQPASTDPNHDHVGNRGRRPPRHYRQPGYCGGVVHNSVDGFWPLGRKDGGGDGT